MVVNAISSVLFPDILSQKRVDMKNNRANNVKNNEKKITESGMMSVAAFTLKGLRNAIHGSNPSELIVISVSLVSNLLMSFFVAKEKSLIRKSEFPCILMLSNFNVLGIDPKSRRSKYKLCIGNSNLILLEPGFTIVATDFSSLNGSPSAEV